MNKIISGGLATALVASGLGLVASPAQAAPTPTTQTRAALGLLPLDLCDVLPLLCDVPIVGPLLENVDDALEDLVGTASTGSPEQIQDSVETLVTAVVESITGTTGGDQLAIANQIAEQLAGSGLDPAVITQVLAGLGASGTDMPLASQLSTLVEGVLDTVQDIVDGLLGIGGQTPDPTQVTGLVEDLLAALSGGDAAELQVLLTQLLTSLPGGSTLDLSTLTDLIEQIVDTLQGALGGGTSTTIINNVTDALNPNAPAGPAAAAVSATPGVSSPKGTTTSVRPVIKGTGTPGATVTVRSSTGTVLGAAPVRSTGSFSVTSRKLKIGAYRITATQVESGRTTSAASAVRTFRIVSAKPVITTKSKKKFSTKRPKITGIGFPRARITLRTSSGTKLGSVKVRTDGTWTITSKRLSTGTRKIKAVQTGHGKKKTTKVRIIRIR